MTPARQLAARAIAAITDVCCDIWYTFRPPEDSWAMLGVGYRDRTIEWPADLPGAVPADGPPLPALQTLLVCEKSRGGCGARVNAPCLDANGKPTRPHKARREPRRSRRER